MSRNCITVGRMLAAVVALATAVCFAAQTKVPRPGLLTKGYNFGGVSFRYPDNWMVDDTGAYHVTVAPSLAFLKKADGGRFVTHGLFLYFVNERFVSKSTDEVAQGMIEAEKGQGEQAQKNPPQVKRIDNGSCGEILNAETPYAGTETVMICALRLGNAYILTEMFSPTADWKQYKAIFSRILETFSAVAIPPPGPLTAEYVLPGIATFRYPNNWIVAKSKEDNAAFPFIRSQHPNVKDDDTDVVIGPSSAFYQAHGRRQMTHGFHVEFLGSYELSISTDEATRLLLEGGLVDGVQHSQSGETPGKPPQLTHVNNGSCTERLVLDRFSQMICALRLGNAYIWTSMWSPNADWKEYKAIFSRILETFSAVAGRPTAAPGTDTATKLPSVDSRLEAYPVLTGREVSQTAFPAMVTLVMRGGNGQTMSLGSGFFVAARLVATNPHVVTGTTSGMAKRIGEDKGFSVLGFVAVDATNDIAILKVSDSSPATLSIAAGFDISIGDTIYAIGSPEGFEGTISQGVISGVRERRGARLLQISAPISPGSSGGPVLDQRARVVGISVATYDEGQNLNFAVPSDCLSTLLTHTSALQPLSALPAPW